MRVIESSSSKKLAVAANITSLLQAADFAAFRTAGSIAGSGANADITSLTGTTTNDNAATGKIGEYLESEILIGSHVQLTNATAANITSLSLTAGDWNVWGQVNTDPAATTTTSLVAGWISS